MSTFTRWLLNTALILWILTLLGTLVGLVLMVLD